MNEDTIDPIFEQKLCLTVIKIKSKIYLYSHLVSCCKIIFLKWSLSNKNGQHNNCKLHQFIHFWKEKKR